MPKVSVNILTKNRAELLKKALASIRLQSFTDYEIIVVDDGSTDGTAEALKNLKIENLKIINHEQSFGITQSRQEALEKSSGEYIAILDDDDEWVDSNKLSQQVKFLDEHPDYVLVGGGIEIERLKDLKIERFRPEKDGQIRNSMLIKNNFFTSTVMFRKSAAVEVGGFIADKDDFAEDYDLWLRLGKIGKMFNFHKVFTHYTHPSYNIEKKKAFLAKQLRLIQREKNNYPHFWIAKLVLKLRLII